jgi:hypothetical protein
MVKIFALQGLQREDLVVKFGQLTQKSFSSSSLQLLADVVAENENVGPPSHVSNWHLKNIAHNSVASRSK